MGALNTATTGTDDSLPTAQGYLAAARPGALDPADVIDGQRPLAAGPGSNSPPVVEVSDVTVQPGHWVGLAGLITAFDPDPGDTVVSYALFDRGGEQTGHFWTPADGRLAAGESHVISAAELPQVRIFAATGARTEKLWVAAHDGFEWGEWARFTLTSGAGGNPPPQVTVSDVSIDTGRWVELEGLLRASDPDPGDVVLNYALFERGSHHTGYFWTPEDGRLPAGQSNVITADELAGVRIFAGDHPGDEKFWVSAHDGHSWSPWTRFTVTATDGSAFAMAELESTPEGAAIAPGDVLDGGGDANRSAATAPGASGMSGASSGELLSSLVVDQSEVA